MTYLAEAVRYRGCLVVKNDIAPSLLWLVQMHNSGCGHSGRGTHTAQGSEVGGGGTQVAEAGSPIHKGGSVLT